MHPESSLDLPGTPSPDSLAWRECPAAALVLGRSGEVLACNRAFRELLEPQPHPDRIHLVRDGLLNEASLAELFRLPFNPVRLRLGLIAGDSREFLAAVGPGPGEATPPRALQVVLLPAGPVSATEAALRRELHRLEDLLAATGRPQGEASAAECWRGAAQGLIEHLPGPGVLLDRNLRVVWPLQEGSDAPVLCSVHLLGSPGRCPGCLAARALAERRRVETVIDGCKLLAGPLPGGFILEWREASPVEGERSDGCP